MLESFRKYTGLMLVVLILLFLGLVFLMDGGGSRGYGSGPTVVTAHGRSYPKQEFDRVAENPIRLMQDLAGQQTNFQGMLTISRYLNSLAIPPDGGPFDARRFLVNRVNLQNAAREFGIHASQEEVEELIQKVIFADRQGAFNGEGYSRYVKRQLPRLGMGVQDMNEILGEMVIMQKLEEILGAGLQASRDTVRANVADRQQQITYQVVSFPRSRFEAAQNPSEEEIKTYWEEHRGAYLSEAQRRITYVEASPDYEALAAELGKAKEEAPDTPANGENAPAPVEEDSGGGCDDAPDNEPAEAENDAAPTRAEEAESETAPPGESPPGTTTPPVTSPPVPSPLPTPGTTPPDPKDALSQEEQEAAIRDLGIKIDDLWTRIYENDGQQFEEFAREAGFEVKTAGLYTRDTAPDELKEPLRDIPGKLAVDATFQRDKGTTSADAISDVRRVGEDKWFLFRIDEAIEPKELDWEEAREQVRKDLVQERALEEMTAAAEKAREAVGEAMKGGKSFEDAAKEQDLTYLRRDEATLAAPIPGEPLPQDVFNLASKVTPGELSEVLTQQDEESGVYRSLFVYVDKRELVDSPSYQNILEQSYRRAGDTLRQLALQNWFAQQYAAAGVQFPAP